MKLIKDVAHAISTIIEAITSSITSVLPEVSDTLLNSAKTINNVAKTTNIITAKVAYEQEAEFLNDIDALMKEQPNTDWAQVSKNLGFEPLPQTQEKSDA
jgi:predicted DNA-binding ArsR family transcriptional regulator